MTTVQTAIQAMLSSTVHGTEHFNQRPARPVITISRDHGAWGRQIADALGERLGIPVYDHEILDKIAERLHTDPKTVDMLDESIARARDMWLMRLFTGQDLTEDSYRNHLVNVLLSLGRSGGVLLGRGANVVLSTSCALRVRVTASPEVRQQRVAERFHISTEEAHEKIVEIDANRGRFVWELFQRRNNDPTNYDLVVNTDRFETVEPVVDMLIAAYNAIALAHQPIPASA